MKRDVRLIVEIVGDRDAVGEMQKKLFELHRFYEHAWPAKKKGTLPTMSAEVVEGNVVTSSEGQLFTVLVYQPIENEEAPR